ncbi:hypothetical protein ACIA6E_31305 [Streptomyces sp. NPDC051815]|uniref:nSTAND1 domain-containing NTPase n=1 Tax=Streptomyces sp. NPDC051815 TaxID=3365674 RepID=UPI0037879B23
MTSSEGERENEREGAPEVRMEAYASDSGTIYLAAGSQHVAGRDLHLHYWDGTHRVDRTRPGTGTGDDCPYPGLSAFGVEQAAWYFGRDPLRARLTARLDTCLREGGALAVVAPSGAGKSSLLRAGLVPDLAAGALPGSRRWPSLVFTPTADPMRALATHLAALTDGDPEQTAADLRSAPDEVAARLRTALAARRAGRLVVVVDQAEELFTLVADAEERRRFTTALDRLARAGGPALVVYGLRADFYARWADLGSLRTALEERQVLIGPMTGTQLREAVLFPARAVGLEVEDGLVELLLTDLAGPAGGDADYDVGLLPHLAHALRLTWQRRHGNRMTVSAYRETGRIHGAVAQSAEEAYAKLGPDGRAATEVIFRRLVRLGDGDGDTRRTVPVGRLTEGLDPRTADAVLSAFTKGRLLTHRQDTVTISHEALLRAWPQLRTWTDTHRADQLLRQQIEEDAAAWAGKRHDRAHLYRGSRLDNALEWAARTGNAGLGPTPREFLDASRRLARRSAQLLRGAVAALTVLTLLAVTGMITAQLQSGRADQSRRFAEEQRRLAVGRSLRAQAENLRDSDPHTSLRLGLAAQRLDPTTEGRQGLLTTLQQTRFDGASPDGAIGPTGGLAAFFHGGTLLATGGDRTPSVDLWDTTDAAAPRHLAALTGLPDAAAGVATTPDGRTTAVVTGASPRSKPPVRELSLWNTADRRTPVRLPFRPGIADVRDAAFSPDGRTLAVVAAGTGGDGAEGTLTLWDTSDPAAPRMLSGPTAATDADTVRYSADGRTLITASALRTAHPSPGVDTIAHFSGWQLWDTTDARRPRPVARQLGHTPGTLAVSPAGPVLAVASGHRLAVWQFTDRAAPRRIALLEHAGQVTTAAFRPDGRGLVTATEGGRTQLWDITDPDRPAGPTPLSGPGKPDALAFSGDGAHVVIADGSRSVRRWRAAPRTAPGPSSAPTTGEAALGEAAFSPDGRRLAVGGHGGDVHQWDVSDPARPRALPPLPGTSGRRVETLAFDRTGATLAVGTAADVFAVNGEIVLWDVSDAERPRRRTALPVPTGVTSLAFSPRTALLAATGRELPAGATWFGIWDTGNPVPERKFLHESLGRLLDETEERPPTVRRWVIGATPTAFAPDGRRLALAGSLWDVSDPSAPVRVRHAGRGKGDPPTAPSGLVGMGRAAFSPDGSLLAADGSGDKGVVQWKVGAELSYAPVGPALPVGKTRQIVYHPGGRLVATAEQHGSVRLWDVSDPLRPALAATVPETAGDLRFSPDGRTLALTLAEGGGVRIWDLGDLPAIVTDPAGLACRIVGTGLSEHDWTTLHASGLPYQDTCAR